MKRYLVVIMLMAAVLTAQSYLSVYAEQISDPETIDARAEALAEDEIYDGEETVALSEMLTVDDTFNEVLEETAAQDETTAGKEAVIPDVDFVDEYSIDDSSITNFM